MRYSLGELSRFCGRWARAGAFHSMKNSGLNFRKFSVTNGTSFCGIFRKGVNLTRCTEIVGNFSPGIFVLFDFPPGISIFRKFNNFWISWKLSKEKFPGKFPLVHLSPFLNFRNFLLNGKHLVSHRNERDTYVK